MSGRKYNPDVEPACAWPRTTVECERLTNRRTCASPRSSARAQDAKMHLARRADRAMTAGGPPARPGKDAILHLFLKRRRRHFGGISAIDSPNARPSGGRAGVRPGSTGPKRLRVLPEGVGYRAAVGPLQNASRTAVF